MGDDLMIRKEKPMEEGSLRLITYLTPSMPTEYFTLLVQYLETKLNRHIYLMVETRSSGPLADRPDPFSANEADIAILSSTELDNLFQKAKGFVNLIPAATFFAHPGANNRPVYFSDVIIHKDNRDKYKEFHYLHGAKWAFSSKTSVSSYIRPLYELKKMGQNANYFTKIVETGSHTKSIEMVLDHTVDGAAVDSIVLGMQKKMNSEIRDKIFILKSWGPITVHPMVVNTRLSSDLQRDISECLLNMHSDTEWCPQFSKFNLIKFLPIGIDDYSGDDEVRKGVSEMRLESAVYY